LYVPLSFFFTIMLCFYYYVIMLCESYDHYFDLVAIELIVLHMQNVV